MRNQDYNFLRRLARRYFRWLPKSFIDELAEYLELEGYNKEEFIRGVKE